jgi:hypothetical protein
VYRWLVYDGVLIDDMNRGELRSALSSLLGKELSESFFDFSNVVACLSKRNWKVAVYWHPDSLTCHLTHVDSWNVYESIQTRVWLKPDETRMYTEEVAILRSAVKVIQCERFYAELSESKP